MSDANPNILVADDELFRLDTLIEYLHAAGYATQAAADAASAWAILEADPAYADKVVLVRFARETSRIRVLIRDQGRGFDWQRYLNMDPARAGDIHGRGIAMSRMLSFDSIRYLGSGNEVEVTIHVPRG